LKNEDTPSLAGMPNHMSTKFGPKTTQLQKLTKAGFNVPAFVALSNTDLDSMSHAKLADQVLSQIKADRYAVRSSAFIEDTESGSMAGQFSTKLDVGPDGLEEAIDYVTKDAKEKLGSLKEFSVLVQEYIDPDWAGVVFTRNPKGGREMVIEFVKGSGEQLVSGKKKAENLELFRSEPAVRTTLPKLEELREQSVRIEQLFSSPQDIEWAIKKKKLYILQSRPITSLDKDQNTVSEYLDQNLPEGKFYFEKTLVTEIAPTPSDATFKLLKSLYQDDGPVAKAYQKLGVEYKDTDFLIRIGGELFVDREKELHSLLPTYSYLHTPDYKPKSVSLKGMKVSISNQTKLAKAKFDLENLYQELKDRLASSDNVFVDDYQVIFTVNIAAEQAIQKLKRALPKDLSVAQVLRMKTSLKSLDELEPPKWLIGNSLEIEDQSKFKSVSVSTPDLELKNKRMESAVFAAQQFEQLREYGRWLAIKNVTQSYKKGSTKTSIKKELPLPLPKVLTDKPIVGNEQEPVGVSVGEASGVLVDEASFKKTKGKKILVVRDLVPSLTQYLSDVEGIISENGGLLSHFSIIARESHLPVIVNVPVSELKLGSLVSIDGTTGEIME